MRPPAQDAAHVGAPATALSVFILGAGQAGVSLAVALRAAGVRLTGVHGRQPPGGRAAPLAGELPYTVGVLPPALADASVVLVTVRDAQLEEALDQLAAQPLAPGTVVLHASGALEPAAAPLRSREVPVGTFHPLLPLADPARAAAALRQGWIGLDGDEAAVHAGELLARALGARTLRIPAGGKARYHAAAVLASNLPVALAALASALLRGQGIPAADADAAVHALLAGAVRNLAAHPLDASGAAAVLTGPLRRGDVSTVQRHLEALAAEPTARAVYLSLAAATLDLLDEAAGAAGAPVPAARARHELRQALAAAADGSPVLERAAAPHRGIDADARAGTQ